MEDIIISKHAVDRFVERLQKITSAPEETIRKLLAKAKEEKIDQLHRVKRLLKHNCQEAIYLENSGWRFVIIDGILTTIERRKTGQN